MHDDEIGHRRAEQHGVEQGPVGDRVRSVLHPLGHDVRVRHGAGIEMVARERDRSLEFAECDQLVDAPRQCRALAMAEPGDAGRQALEGDMLTCELDPVGDDLVVREHLQQKVVDAGDVALLA
ncbi:hypothetical protein D9M72_561730 [compost metagenome]